MIGRIDLFQQIKEFDYLCVSDGLPGVTGNYRSVYFALLSINNSSFWSEIFEVDFQYIISYVKGVNHYARAKVSLKVLTEKPTANTVGNAVTGAVSNPVGNAGSSTTANTVGNAVTGAHNIKTVNNKLKKEEIESKNDFIAPSAINVLNEFKKVAKPLDWKENFIEKKAAKFIDNNAADNWARCIRLGWREKVSSWVSDELNAETNTPTILKNSDGRPFPTRYDINFFNGLKTNEDRAMMFKVLKANRQAIVGKKQNGDSIWGDLPAGVEISDEWYPRYYDVINKPTIKMPYKTFTGDMNIPPDVQQKFKT